MKNSLDQTFKAIRQLPVEVSFNKVKKWVNDFSPQSQPKSSWSFFKSIFPPINKN